MFRLPIVDEIESEEGGVEEDGSEEVEEDGSEEGSEEGTEEGTQEHQNCPGCRRDKLEFQLSPREAPPRLNLDLPHKKRAKGNRRHCHKHSKRPRK